MGPCWLAVEKKPVRSIVVVIVVVVVVAPKKRPVPPYRMLGTECTMTMVTDGVGDGTEPTHPSQRGFCCPLLFESWVPKNRPPPFSPPDAATGRRGWAACVAELPRENGKECRRRMPHVGC